MKFAVSLSTLLLSAAIALGGCSSKKEPEAQAAPAPEVAAAPAAAPVAEAPKTCSLDELKTKAGDACEKTCSKKKGKKKAVCVKKCVDETVAKHDCSAHCESGKGMNHECAVHCATNDKDQTCTQHCAGDPAAGAHDCAKHCEGHTDGAAKACVAHCSK